MATIEKVLREYELKNVKSELLISIYSKLVPRSIVGQSEYYNDKENHVAKGYYDLEVNFKRKMTDLNSKYISIQKSKNTIKLNINNAYLHPQKFKFEQIDHLLSKTAELYL